MIAIIGAGAFGSALAMSVGDEARLWGRSLRAGARRTHKLPKHTLPDTVETVSSQAAAMESADFVLLAVPMTALAKTITKLPETETPLIACCKGIDPKTGLGPAATLAAATGRPAGILTGPSFATEIAAGLPTALVLGFENEAVARQAQHRISSKTLRVYRSSDVAGLELAGALKNVLAIAAGAVIGAGLGQSAQAALLTRGMAEIARLARRQGAAQETIMGLAGMGDVMLTAFSEESRNFRYGLALGRQRPFDEAATVEGVSTARAVAGLAHEYGIELPVLATTNQLISGEVTIMSALETLMSRPLKEE